LPTVDDLVISLRIKETGKLGQLKKQLDTLVGKTGRGVGAGMMFMKRDLNILREDTGFIKRRILFLMPTEIPGKARPYAMAETARIASVTLEKNIRAYAEKLIPQRQDVLEATMAEFGVETREDLIDALEDKIKDWQLRLEDVMKRDWVSESAQKFIGRIDDLIKRKTFTVGKAKELMRDIDESIGERNKEIAELLKKLGLTVKPEQWIARLRPEKFAKVFPSNEGLREDWEEMGKLFDITSKENLNTLMRMWDTIDKLEGGTPEALEVLSKKFGVDLKELWNLTKEEVRKSEDLRTVALLTFRAMGAERGKKAIGFPLGFRQMIFDVLKEMRTRVPLGGSEELRKRQEEKLIARFEKEYGKSMKYLFEKYRIDFLITDVQETLDKIEKIFGKDIADKLQKVDSIFIEQKNILSETNRGQIRVYEALTGNKRLMVLATEIMSSFTSMFPEIMSKRMDIALERQKAGLIKELTEEKKEEIREEAEERLGSERLEAEILKLCEQYPDIEVVGNAILTLIRLIVKESKGDSQKLTEIKGILDGWAKGEKTPPQPKGFEEG